MGTARGLLRSSSAATAAQLVRIVALQATHIVVRRQIPPEEWGVWAWIEPLFLLLATLRDLGVPSHIVRLRPIPLRNLLRLQLVWGGALAAAIVAGAPLLARLNEEPSAALVTGLRVMTLYLLVEGIAAVALVWFEAHLRIERTLPAELIRTGLYCVIVVAASFSGLSFWSFVLAQIAAQSAFAIALWSRARADGLTLDRHRGSTVGLVRDSIPVAWVWGLAMAVTYADFFVVGKLFDHEHVGLYQFGYQYAFLIFRILQQPLGRSLYPAFIAYRHDPAEQFRAYRLGTVLFLALEAPAALFLALNAERITLLLAGKEYLGAAPYLALLAFAPLVDPLGRFGGELLVARHHDGARLVSLGLNLGMLVIGGTLLCRWLGSPLGMAWANFVPLGAPIVIVYACRAVPRREIRRLLGQLAEVYALPLIPFGLVFAFTAGGSWVRLAASIAAGAVAVGWAIHRHGSEYREFLLESPAANV